MGAGKSTVGKLLAAHLKRQFVDTDALIEESLGVSIKNIFASKGEAYFRGKEEEAAKTLLLFKPGTLVAATGGGMLLSEENRATLQKAGVIILLKVSAKEALKRVGQGQERPLILQQEDPEKALEELLAQREKAYAHFDLLIDTEGKTAKEVCLEILNCFN